MRAPANLKPSVAGAIVTLLVALFGQPERLHASSISIGLDVYVTDAAGQLVAEHQPQIIPGVAFVDETISVDTATGSAQATVRLDPRNGISLGASSAVTDAGAPFGNFMQGALAVSFIRWNDTLTVHGDPLATGLSGIIEQIFAVEGSFDMLNAQGQNFGQLFATSSGPDNVLHQDFHGFFPASASGFLVSKVVNELVVLQTPWVFGLNAITLGLGNVDAECHSGGSRASVCHAISDFGYTATLVGFRLLDNAGRPVPALLTSESGIDYLNVGAQAPTVPEPAAVILVVVGIGWLGARRRTAPRPSTGGPASVRRAGRRRARVSATS